MAVEICPVCGGKGIVPNGFYMTVGTPYYSTTNLSPETCRSCGGRGYIETYGGRGYIETYGESLQNPQLQELDERLKKLEDLSNLSNLTSLQSLVRASSIPEKCCASCKYIEDAMYMSNPPKFKCLMHQTWYEWSEIDSRSCHNWEKREYCR